MKHIKAGYVVHGELKNVSENDAKALDIINIAFAHCVNSEIEFTHEDDLKFLPIIKSYNPNIKILFSVGGWGSGGFSPMASTTENRKKFAASCLEFVNKYSLDGIDIDWEYPGLDWAGIEASPNDKVNFTLMLEEIKNTFENAGRKDLMLTIAVGCDSYFIANSEMDKAARVLDYVSIMTYDMRGCGEPFTGHHTNLLKYGCGFRGDHRSVEHSVRIYNEAGVPLEKIVIGAAFYSRMWKDVRANDEHPTGLCCDAGPGNYGPGYSELLDDYIGVNGFTRYFDYNAKAPYIFDGNTFISYDDPESISAKCEYIKEKGLLGIMYWEHSCDKTRTLLKAINENL